MRERWSGHPAPTRPLSETPAVGAGSPNHPDDEARPLGASAGSLVNERPPTHAACNGVAAAGGRWITKPSHLDRAPVANRSPPMSQATEPRRSTPASGEIPSEHGKHPGRAPAPASAPDPAAGSRQPTPDEHRPAPDTLQVDETAGCSVAPMARGPRVHSRLSEPEPNGAGAPTGSLHSPCAPEVCRAGNNYGEQSAHACSVEMTSLLVGSSSSTAGAS
jgi:hypothetical protein